MKILKDYLGLYTDMYQLTMMEAYFKEGKHNCQASFDYFFRKIPYEGGFVVFSGLSELIDSLSEIKFGKDDIDFLHKKKFSSNFLNYLEGFSFAGNIHSVEEGTIVFPNEPIVTVEGKLSEIQLLETYLLNILNFNSLISTKAARIRLIAKDKVLSDFGLRRAQGFGGLQASRAAIIGGFDSTSNVLAAKLFDLIPVGTMAHSFIQSYDDELTAFRKYAETFPDSTVLLIDTYNTLESGLPNAITVAKELEESGHQLKGIRLDSGDLAYLSKAARKKLDDAGLSYVKIVVSNQLDERVIKSLFEQQAPIDVFGVGTNLVIGSPDSALDGVFKLSMCNNQPRLKISENIQKVTLPGMKKIIRYTDDEGYLQADAITLKDEDKIERMFHPFDKEKSKSLIRWNENNITQVVVADGKSKIKTESVGIIRERVKENLSKLPAEYKRFEFPHIYKVGISEKLMQLREELKTNFSNNNKI
ncbi:MAG TPA: nicotinate phosphoribosyltransferase [Ignavibacteriaceae bacterium]|jgi:nicotinate phosphoribosyltransferase|nr:MAG: Nicotinate phosphoribosyltransferase pncB2 [Ignavibacteria bacterium ADurb.Bin266]OQY74197.1 MAG: nicotinate phosphoribosyltransferase [Ignavibacteriales bacterium UTCHB2]HQF41866.1 nicotinate phosphoribosyltransferase [Ignavibacteriaceae bacterium]HQI39837.1 nicotinate phosphoribosyltransferase [Ignavibacteriaceae bacterium]HQJ45500.1 nicotinate phosphoribosyltransferase [Ignavibacteriaceae bacterium]